MYLIIKTNVREPKNPTIEVLNSAQELKYALKFLKEAALEFVCDENGKKHAEHCLKAEHVTDSEITENGYFLRFVSQKNDEGNDVDDVMNKYNVYQRTTTLGTVWNSYEIQHEFVFQLTEVNAESIGFSSEVKVTQKKHTAGKRTIAQFELINELQKVLDEKNKNIEIETSDASLREKIETQLSKNKLITQKVQHEKEKDDENNDEKEHIIRIRVKATGSPVEDYDSEDDTDDEQENEYENEKEYKDEKKEVEDDNEVSDSDSESDTDNDVSYYDESDSSDWDNYDSETMPLLLPPLPTFADNTSAPEKQTSVYSPLLPSSLDSDPLEEDIYFKY